MGSGWQCLKLFSHRRKPDASQVKVIPKNRHCLNVSRNFNLLKFNTVVVRQCGWGLLIFHTGPTLLCFRQFSVTIHTTIWGKIYYKRGKKTMHPTSHTNMTDKQTRSNPENSFIVMQWSLTCCVCGEKKPLKAANKMQSKVLYKVLLSSVLYLWYKKLI